MNKRPDDKQLTVKQVVNAMQDRKIVVVNAQTGVAKQTVAKFFEDNASEVAYSTRTIERLSIYILDDLERLAKVCGVKISY